MRNMNMRLKFIFSFSCFLLGTSIFILGISTAHAATLFLSPKTPELKIGQNFDLEVRVNSEDQGFNAAQATIDFPKDILEVKSLDYSPEATIFNFWLEEPKFSNDEGKITFIGGTTNGVVGASIQILKIIFTAKGSGEADIAVSDAAITASDGSGTNILSTIETARFTIKPTTIAPPKTQAPTEPTETEIVPAPIQIVKTPSLAEKLPKKPEISVPLYPEPTNWYNAATNFFVQWELPEDISGISTDLNQNSVFTPAPQSEGLFDSKIFPVLKDGIWYLHIRFRNNVGWGPAIHYRLAIDTVPPLPFNIDVMEGVTTGNPTPTLQFKTSDGLSGLRHYLVRIGNGDTITVENEIFTLPLQAPGKQTVLVRAVDKAANVRENSIELEILPIASPVITFLNKNVFVGEGGVTSAGTGPADARILLFIKNKEGAVVAQATAKVDKNGNWEARFDEVLKKGKYFIEATTQDERGALSLPAKSELFKIREKPLLTLGNVEITQFWFFMGLITIIVAAFALGWFSYQLRRKQMGRKVVIAQRDVVNAFTNLKNNVDKMLKNYTDKRVDEREAEEMEFILKEMKVGLEKTQKYITENIKEINE